jgi:seryl-tRNA synthetase
MDINYIRQNPDQAKKNQVDRFCNPDLIDTILELDAKWKTANHDSDLIGKLRNILRKHFKTAPELETIRTDPLLLFSLLSDIQNKIINPELLSKDQLTILGKAINDTLANLKIKTDKLLNNRDDQIMKLGNFLHSKVIISNDESSNELIYQSDISLENKPLTHVELCEKLGLVDLENGIKISGNRGYFFTGIGVKFNLALINYAIEFMEQKGYTLMQTPHMVNNDVMSKITQLTEYDESLYKLENQDKYLIATSEQPLTAYFANKQLAALPIKFGGLSSCYRKETGKHGHQMRGIYRVHQFEKVEQFCVTKPNESWDMFNKMINICKEFYDSLGIKYRIVNIVSGALNNAASMKYDLEGYFCGNKNFGELVSCTNCLDYFSKRINTKSNNEYVHMLNCTLMANTRVMCCLMEQYQTDYGMEIPEKLKKYMGIDKIVFRN